MIQLQHYNIYWVYNNKSEERYQIKTKVNNTILEESETDERHQIENLIISNMRKIKEPRGDDDLVDTDTES